MDKMIYVYLNSGLSASLSDQQKAIDIFLKEKNLKADKCLNNPHSCKKELISSTLQSYANLLETGDTLVFYAYPVKNENLIDFFEFLEKLINKGIKIYSVYDIFSSQINHQIEEISLIGKAIGQVEKKLLYFQIKK